MCTKKLYESFCLTSYGQRPSFAEMIFRKIESFWDTIQEKMRTHIFQFSFLETDNRVFGNYGINTPESFIYQVKKLNYLMMSANTDKKRDIKKCIVLEFVNHAKDMDSYLESFKVSEKEIYDFAEICDYCHKGGIEIRFVKTALTE